MSTRRVLPLCVLCFMVMSPGALLSPAHAHAPSGDVPIVFRYMSEGFFSPGFAKGTRPVLVHCATPYLGATVLLACFLRRRGWRK